MLALHTPPLVALALLAVALPVSIWVARSDLARMTIPNRAVMALAAGFAALGLLLLPLEGWTLGDWAWRWAHLALLLPLGVLLNALGLMGAGDAKLIAAGAPFVAAADWRAFVLIYAAVFLATWGLHRAARATAGPALAPGWASWTSGRRFPMGVALGGALVAYLALAALG